MYDWLAKWARLTPERIAIEEAGGGRRLTYLQLDNRAARLAVALRDRFGVGPGDRVAWLALNSAMTFEAAFACVDAHC